MMWHGWGMGMGWGGMFLGFLFLLLFLGGLALLIGLVIWAVVRSSGRRARWERPVASHEKPLETLRRRYAQGELPREEYLAMKEDLES